MSDIPRVFHQIWLGSPLPDWARYLHERMVRMNPGWTGHIWTDAEIDVMGLYNRREYLSVQGLAFKSDVARYEIIARHGGVYSDFDLIWLRPLEDAISLSFDFVARENFRSPLNNGIFGCRRGSPFAWDLVGDLPEEYAHHENVGGKIHQTGTAYFAKVAAKHAGHVARLPWQTFHPYTLKDFQSADLSTHPTATAIHFFNSNRLEGKIRAMIEAGKI